MSTGDGVSQSALGFLTVLEHDQLGLTGGYLVLNTTGRPLEFHCTAPVKPNRAQRILFGATLEPYLYGEQIGQTLLAKASVEPLAVWTDVPQVLTVRDYTPLPVALVQMDTAALPHTLCGDATTSEWRVDAGHQFNGPLTAFQLGRNRLCVPVARCEDQARILEKFHTLEAFDLAEPFVRIREAIEEAHKIGRSQ